MTHITKINDLLYFKGKIKDIHIKLEQTKDSDFQKELSYHNIDIVPLDIKYVK